MDSESVIYMESEERVQHVNYHYIKSLSSIELLVKIFEVDERWARLKCGSGIVHRKAIGVYVGTA
jgi:diaminopimelate epimerase